MEPTTPPPNQPEVTQPTNNVYQQIPISTPPNQPASNQKRLTIIVVTVAIVLIGGVLSILLLGSNKNKSTSNDSSGAAGLGLYSPGAQLQARDTKRKTDINALQGQTEAYEAQYGFYPTLANINDANWRATYMKGLDPSALQDPNGQAQALVDSPAADAYAYQATPAGCDNVKTQCTSYSLTATLEASGTYTKYALN